MKIPRKTDPIDDLINELLKPIKLLRELKKAKQEIARLTEVLNDEEQSLIKCKKMEGELLELSVRNGYLEAMIVKQQERIEFLENMIKFYEAKLNATS